ncbi:hypothetical protein D3C85_1707320 [compost metagenome]
MRISSAVQSRTCIKSLWLAKSESAASVVTTLPSNFCPHRVLRFLKKASCGVSARAEVGRDDRVRAAAARAIEVMAFIPTA